ncbi:adenylate/guanylate cyclase domain-containing protein [Alteromonas sp. D210916BOD_24]|uniref:adenylate/guanylate cyclase domain-containing protein n=1 Tax=Alteromonas sp. D210916BOD_24 TaxID=3157618 RepID=UPI00399C8236
MEVPIRHPFPLRTTMNGKRKMHNATVIFTDLSGFQRLVLALGDNKSAALIDTIFKLFDTLALEHSLTPLKTNGDQYILYSASDSVSHQTLPNHSQSPLPLAVAKSIAFACAANTVIKHHPVLIKQRCGLRTGIASGNVISGRSLRQCGAYDIWGETVNCAAMLEHYTHNNSVALCPTSFAAISPSLKRHFVSTRFKTKIAEMNAFVAETDFIWHSQCLSGKRRQLH